MPYFFPFSIYHTDNNFVCTYRLCQLIAFKTKLNLVSQQCLNFNFSASLLDVAMFFMENMGDFTISTPKKLDELHDEARNALDEDAKSTKALEALGGVSDSGVRFQETVLRCEQE